MEVGVNVLFFERKMNGSEWKGNGMRGELGKCDVLLKKIIGWRVTFL